MIPKRRSKPRMNVRAPERVRSPSHLQFVRLHECAIAGKSYHYSDGGMTGMANHVCVGRIESHHCRIEGDGTTGKKPGDDKCVALCSAAHAEGHSIGWKSFEAKYRVDLTSIAAALWKASPHGVKYRREHERTD